MFKKFELTQMKYKCNEEKIQLNNREKSARCFRSGKRYRSDKL